MSLPTLRTAASTRGRVSQNSRSLDASGGPTLGQRIRSRAPLLPVRGRSPPNDGGVVDLEGSDVESREDEVAEPYREPPPSRPGSPPPVPSSSVSAVSVRSSSSRATRISTRERLAQSEAESRALQARLDELHARGNSMRLDTVVEYGSGSCSGCLGSEETPRQTAISQLALAAPCRDVSPGNPRGLSHERCSQLCRNSKSRTPCRSCCKYNRPEYLTLY